MQKKPAPVRRFMTGNAMNFMFDCLSATTLKFTQQHFPCLPVDVRPTSEVLNSPNGNVKTDPSPTGGDDYFISLFLHSGSFGTLFRCCIRWFFCKNYHSRAIFHFALQISSAGKAA